MTFRTVRRFIPLILLSLVGASAPVAPQIAALRVPVTGTYVEARTASVFAGACHYNGERVTEGRSAVMAWSFAGGTYHGVEITGAKVIAAIACDDNLAEPAPRGAVNSSSTPIATPAPPRPSLGAQLGDRLGTVVAVRPGHVTFCQNDEDFTVNAAGFAAMSVRAMPDHACCSQPHLVWYEPLMHVDARRVGYTASAEYDAGGVGDAWQRSDENSAFYGTFHD